MTGYRDLSPIGSTRALISVNNQDKVKLAQIAYRAIDNAVKYAYQLNRIADHLCNHDVVQAFEDALIKGILELGAICDLDEKMERENTEVKE